MDDDPREREERALRWIAWPGPRVYGPGYTAEQVVERHTRYLRSGWSQAGSGAYHSVRVAPETEPGPAWRATYPTLRVGRDPWAWPTSDKEV